MKQQEEQDLVECLTDRELQDLIEEWDRYDTDQSGTITLDEFIRGERKWYADVCQGDLSEDELTERITLWRRSKNANDEGDVGWWEFANSKALLILDAKNALHTVLTPAERADARAVFNAIDTDKGGFIVESEARKFYEAKHEAEVQNHLMSRKQAVAATENSVQRLLRACDADNDGEISYEEFEKEEARNIVSDRLKAGTKTAMSSSLPSAAENPEGADDAGPQVLTEAQIEHAKLEFESIDTDNSGRIESKELKPLFQKLNMDKHMKKDKFNKKVSKAFKKADVDGDKSLDFNEFQQIYNMLWVESMDFSNLC